MNANTLASLSFTSCTFTGPPLFFFNCRLKIVFWPEDLWTMSILHLAKFPWRNPYAWTTWFLQELGKWNSACVCGIIHNIPPQMKIFEIFFWTRNQAVAELIAFLRTLHYYTTTAWVLFTLKYTRNAPKIHQYTNRPATKATPHSPEASHTATKPRRMFYSAIKIY